MALRATDDEGASSIAFVPIEVTQVNDAPTLAITAPGEVFVGVPAQFLMETSDVDDLPSAVSVAVTSTTAVIAQEGIQIAPSATAYIVTVTPTRAGTAGLRFSVSDGEDSTSQVIDFPVSAQNPVAPTAIELSGSVDENAPSGAVVGILTAVDASQAGGHTFSIIDNPLDAFNLEGNQLRVLAPTALDHEAHPVLAVTIQATNASGFSFTGPVLLPVGNVNERPVVSLGEIGLLPPGQASSLTAITLTDPDSGEAAVATEFQVFYGRLFLNADSVPVGSTTGNGTQILRTTYSIPTLQTLITSGALTYVPNPAYEGTEVLRVSCNDQGNSGSGAPLGDEALMPFSVLADAYTAWRLANFTDLELSLPSLSGDTADYDGDTLPNLVEFVLGSLPKDSNNGREKVRLFTVDHSGQQYPAIEVTRRSLTHDFSCLIEVARNFAGWDASEASVTLMLQTEAPDGAETATYRTNFALSTDRNQQLRVRVERITPLP